MNQQKKRSVYLDHAATTAVDPRVVDKFVAKGPNLQRQLQAITGKLNFTSKDLAAIAMAFAKVLAEFPNADRKKRARLFARTLLRKRKPFDRLFADRFRIRQNRIFRPDRDGKDNN